MTTMNVRTTANSRSLIGNRSLIVILTAVAVFALMLGVRAAGGQQGRDKPIQVGSVDFRVVTATGEPVADLKPDEVTLRIDGKIRPIKTLRFVKVTSGMTGAAAADAEPATDPIAPAFETNIAAVAAVPRSIIIIVDDESMPIGQEQKIRSTLSDFVTNLPPADQVALVTVPHGGIKVGLTTDRARLRSGISQISPIQPLADPPCQTRDTLSTLQSTIRLLARTSEQPVVVAFLSASLSGISQMEAAKLPTVTGGGLSSQGGACRLAPDDFKSLGTAVAESRVQLFIIHPDYSQAPVREGIENLMGQTGAPLFHLSAGTEPGLYRMARETSGYYVATFDTEPDERVGVSHVASIRTTRKDVELRGRPYLVVGRATPAPGAVASSGSTSVTTAFDMVRSGRTFTDLPLRAMASASRTPDGKMNVIGLFEPVDPSAKIMTAAAALIDENGKGIDFWTGEADKLTTWPAAVGLIGPPGKYRIRIGAIDASGRTGLVDFTIVADLATAGSLKIGGLVLGVSRGGTFTPRLQFSTEASAVAYLELYGGAEGTRVGVVFEVSRTTNGPAMLQVRGVLVPTSEEGKVAAIGTIPVGALGPGDYVIRAIVGAAGQPEGRVLRTLHKAG